MKILYFKIRNIKKKKRSYLQMYVLLKIKKKLTKKLKTYQILRERNHQK